VLNSWPHDPGAFTQGLVFHEGRLLESTGLYGQSTLRQVDLETGQVLLSVPVSAEYFAEGLTLFGGQLLQLTWQAERGFVYRLDDLTRTGEFAYRGEGWGLTHDGARLIMSDGTSRLRFLDPATFAVVGTLDVSDALGPVQRLNELEWVRGQIWANIWQTDRIARIDPVSGQVLGYLDLTGLLSTADQQGREVDVLNGIAFDPLADRIFVTGKLWPRLFEIRPREASPATQR
jgi:glutaminyl-peptide cyclotransferase